MKHGKASEKAFKPKKVKSVCALDFGNAAI